jgi:Domain of unknown function (DUF5679)
MLVGRRRGPETYLGPGTKGGELATYEGYCVKDKKKVQFEGEVVTLKNGRQAAKGKCPSCGTTVMRILGKAEAS